MITPFPKLTSSGCSYFDKPFTRSVWLSTFPEVRSTTETYPNQRAGWSNLPVVFVIYCPVVQITRFLSSSSSTSLRIIDTGSSKTSPRSYFLTVLSNHGESSDIFLPLMDFESLLLPFEQDAAGISITAVRTAANSLLWITFIRASPFPADPRILSYKPKGQRLKLKRCP